MKKESIVNIIKTIAFLIVLAMIILAIQSRVIPFNEQDTNQTATFYETPEDSVDVLIAGTSSIMVGLSPLKLYEDTGITAHVRGSSVQSPHVTYLNIKEALKYQKPDVVAVSIISLLSDYNVDDKEAWMRRGMDYKKLSLDKVIVAKAIVDDSEWQTLGSYIMPIARYHTRYGAILGRGIPDTLGDYDYMHGQYAVYKQRYITDVSDENMANQTQVKLSDKSLDWYKKLAALCEENNIKLLFVAMPDMRWTTGKHNAILKLSDELGADFLDYNANDLIELCDIDTSRDFYDDHHLNAGGSVKATSYFGQYLKEKYGLEASKVSEEIDKQLNNDIERFKSDLQNKEYEVLKAQ